MEISRTGENHGKPCQVCKTRKYRNDLQHLDGQVWANSVDTDQTALGGQDLHCLPFRLHILVTLLYCKTTLMFTF